MRKPGCVVYIDEAAILLNIPRAAVKRIASEQGILRSGRKGRGHKAHICVNHFHMLETALGNGQVEL